MFHNFGLAVLALCFWAAIFAGGVYLMTTASGHRGVDTALRQAGKEALNMRLRPYGADEAKAVWQVIADTPGGMQAERASLRLDLVFPLLYGGALAFLMLVMLFTVGAGGYSAAFLAPVLLAVIADWTENAIHLRQLARFETAPADVSAFMIRIASTATSAKLILVWLSLALILVLPFIFRARG